MKVVYIAGAFRSSTHWGIVCNVRRAEERALDVWAMGAAALCPHLNTANFQGALPDETWIAGTLELLRRCDAVLLVAGWTRSEGTIAEVAEARRLGRPVFDTMGELGNWLHGRPACQVTGP